MKLRLALPILGLLSVTLLPPVVPRWGFEVHRLINRAATTHLPPDFQHFAQWADDLEQLSTAADERKCCVTGESIKHYIDIDDYPEFFTGQLPHTYTEMVTTYGESRVDRNGTAPWAIEASYLDLVQGFATADWEGAVAAAADLGHYVGDLHSPLHLTVNFNGQLTEQQGIHARHESQMTARHLGELEPAPGTVSMIADPLESVFEWIDIQYPGVALILAADLTAQAAAGSTSSDAYYEALWDAVGDETITWIRDASLAVASLWYAAWIEAGSPPLPGSTTGREASPTPGATRVLPNAPNPFTLSTSLRFELDQGGAATLMIFDVSGRRVRRWKLGVLPRGLHEVLWNGRDDAGAALASGVYHVVVTDAAGSRALGRAVLVK